MAFRRWASRRSWGLEQIASAIHVCRRTLSDWLRRWRLLVLDPLARGRPVKRAPVSIRNDVIDHLREFGHHVGVPTIHGCYPDMGKRELEDLVRRFKQLQSTKDSLELHELRWTTPGVVWAMDHTEPPSPIDGHDPEVFAVRDLSSGAALLWMGQPDETAARTRDALEPVIIQNSPPLVIKSDLGGAFLGHETEELLLRSRIFHLRSPGRMPCYNGACEAGIGGMKRRTHAEACRRGRPGLWTSDDLEAARLLANRTVVSPLDATRSPESAWNARPVITDASRREFEAMVFSFHEEVQREYTHDMKGADRRHASPWFDRRAITRALVACGYLQVRRRRIPLPIKSFFDAKIS